MSAQTVVDPRGMRFAAALTTLVLAAVVLTENLWLLAAQVAVFAIGAFGGVRRSPYAVVFARLIRPQLGPPAETEDARPPQFAQLVGLVFATVALVGFLSGAETSASSPPRSHSWPPSSMPCSASAWAARST